MMTVCVSCCCILHLNSKTRRLLVPESIGPVCGFSAKPKNVPRRASLDLSLGVQSCPFATKIQGLGLTVKHTTRNKDRVGRNRSHGRTTAGSDRQGAHDSKCTRSVRPWFGVRGAFLLLGRCRTDVGACVCCVEESMGPESCVRQQKCATGDRYCRSTRKVR